MATTKTIAAAIKLIDAKKENLKRAYDELQSHSSLLSPSFTLPWSAIDAHFSSVQNSLTERFAILESMEATRKEPSPSFHSQAPAKPSFLPVTTNPDESSTLVQHVHQVDSVPNGSEGMSLSVLSPPESLDPTLSSNPLSQNRDGTESTDDGVRVEPVLPRTELKELCERMDGKGLRKYTSEHSSERESIRAELPDAMRYATDPGAMVLDAVEDFYAGNSNSSIGVDNKVVDSLGVRRGCVLLLENLMDINPNLSDEVRERAKNLAIEWKRNLNQENPLEVLGFLHLVAAYGLNHEFDMNEFVDCMVVVAKYRQGTSLCRAIDLGDKVNDLIEKLLANGKHLLAIKFIFEFQMTDRYSPVALLKAYLNESNLATSKLCKEGKNTLRVQNEAIAKELSALKAVLKVIEEHKLESEYPPEDLQKRVEQLEKQKTDKKRTATTVHAANSQQQTIQQSKQQQQLQHGWNKRSRMTAPIGPTTVSMNTSGANPAFAQTPQPHFHQAAGLLPDHSGAYLTSAGVPYGLVGSPPTVVPYTGSSAGVYPLTGAHVGGFPPNSSPAVPPHPHSSESQMTYGLYGTPTTYDGYTLPPSCTPTYYPQ